MVIFVGELLDEAGSGGEETRMRKGHTSDKTDDEKLGYLRSGFWQYFAVIGPLSRHLTFYNPQRGIVCIASQLLIGGASQPSRHGAAVILMGPRRPNCH